MTERTDIKPITVEDLRALEAHGITREIIDGHWVDNDEERDLATGKRHGKVGARIISQLNPFVESHNLGEVYQDNTTYVLEGDPQNIELMLVPDVSFVARERVVE